MTPFDLVSLLLALTAGFGWLNRVLFGLPRTIGILLMGLCASAVVLVLNAAIPAANISGFVSQINFSDVVLNGMLSFLLFAGGLQVDISAMHRQRWPIVIMATIGILISTAIIGLGFRYLGALLGQPVPLVWAFLFGALISPTDPVSVLSILKTSGISSRLRATIEGEALFNDGIGIVLFTILLHMALGSGEAATGVIEAGRMFLTEGGGGVLLGLATGYVAYRAMYAIDEYSVEVLLSLAVVMVTYAAARHLGVSGPIAVVVAGLVVGNRGKRFAMSERTIGYLCPFWTLVDEVLNSVLFLLIGLQIVLIPLNVSILATALTAIPLVLVARLGSVLVPALAISVVRPLARGAILVATWAGVRGGISIALVLSLPEQPEKAVLLASTYFVVLFTVVVQGLSLGAVTRRFAPTHADIELPRP